MKLQTNQNINCSATGSMSTVTIPTAGDLHPWVRWDGPGSRLESSSGGGAGGGVEVWEADNLDVCSKLICFQNPETWGGISSSHIYENTKENEFKRN